MTVELTEHEAKEVILGLRHLFDASFPSLPASKSAMDAYLSAICKMQTALGMEEISPWDRPQDFDA